MDFKAYTEVLQDINTLANRLVNLLGENVVSNLDEEFLVKLLQNRLDLLRNIDDVEKEEYKIEILIMIILSVYANVKGKYDIDLI